MELENKKHERFCIEYIIDHNKTQAAIRAGYSAKSARSQGCALFTKPNVSARIEELEKDVAEALGITAAGVLLSLVETRRQSLEAAPVMEYDPAQKKKVKTGEFTFDSNGANKANELIGKYLSMWSDKMNITVAPVVVDDIGD